MSIIVPLEGFGGGGANLNFKVVAYATEAALLAAAPKENTIGIITGTPISAYAFSATEPAAPVEGMVWITVGTSSTMEFNALKKNTLQVYPLSAKQYVGGAWVDVTAMSYQCGKWVSWITYLYNAGDECTAVTGGWTTDGFTYGSIAVTSGSFMKDADKLVFEVTPENGGVCPAGCRDAIDLTSYKTLVITYANTALSSGYGIQLDVSTTKDLLTDRVAVLSTTSAVGTETTATLSVEGLSGKHYIGAHSTNAQSGEIYSVRLE